MKKYDVDCFVIMPIGNPETEIIWKEVYYPVIDKAELNPVRIKEEDDGTLMPVQIIQYINNSQLLIADLTFARPNCYLEIGYTWGINKYSNLILCCREDHNQDSPNFSNNAHKVHFDVQSYGIIWWQTDKLEKFSNDLIDIIKKRQEIIKRQPISGEVAKKSSKVSKLLTVLKEAEEDLAK